MQLELSAEIEETLAAEGRTRGLSAAELSTQLLVSHARRLQCKRPINPSRRDWTIEDYIAALSSRNPNFATNDPYATDWQALKAEGRRY